MSSTQEAVFALPWSICVGVSTLVLPAVGSRWQRLWIRAAKSTRRTMIVHGTGFLLLSLLMWAGFLAGYHEWYYELLRMFLLNGICGVLYVCFFTRAFLAERLSVREQR